MKFRMPRKKPAIRFARDSSPERMLGIVLLATLCLLLLGFAWLFSR